MWRGVLFLLGFVASAAGQASPTVFTALNGQPFTAGSRTLAPFVATNAQFQYTTRNAQNNVQLCFFPSTSTATNPCPATTAGLTCTATFNAAAGTSTTASPNFAAIRSQIRDGSSLLVCSFAGGGGVYTGFNADISGITRPTLYSAINGKSYSGATETVVPIVSSGTGQTMQVTVAGAVNGDILCFSLPTETCAAAGAATAGRCTNPITAAAPVAPATTATVTATFPAGFAFALLEAQSLVGSSGIRICRHTQATVAPTYNAGVDSGFVGAFVWSCNDNAPATRCSARTFSTNGLTTSFTATQLAQMSSRFTTGATCCSDTAVTANAAAYLVRGACYNPRVQSCCGGTLYFPTTTKCCATASGGTVTALSSRCTCSGVSGTVGASALAQHTSCPSDAPFCCLATKYTEFAPNNVAGTCFNADRERCCDTGAVYNPGTQQCCSINGLQSLDIPCPCGAAADCAGGQITPTGRPTQANSGFQCCAPTAPAPSETAFCSKYTNYPTAVVPGATNQAKLVALTAGQAPAITQRCTGICIDPTYQVCCNGASCSKNFEKCCNTTCCNKFTGTCEEGTQNGAAGRIFNWRDFGTKFTRCTTVEQMNPLKVFWVFILPTGLLIAMLFGLALVLAFANKATARHFSFLEKVLVGLSVFVLLVSIPLFFSPAYKYGVVASFAALISILSASARVRFLNIAALVLVAVALLYLFDPFSSNAFLGVPSLRLGGTSIRQGFADAESSGVLHITEKIWRDERRQTSRVITNSQAFCTSFYNYFRFDTGLHDSRVSNPEVPTFGYCSRGWTFALLMFEGFLLLFLVLLFVLLLLALLDRFRKYTYVPVDLQLVPY